MAAHSAGASNAAKASLWASADASPVAASDRPNRPDIPTLGVIVFFLSGFAALVYQVVWQRLLVIFSGADIHSVTIIVAAFMGGLGVGGLIGGRLADRLGPGGSVWAVAIAELLIGVFGLVSKPLYYDLLYQRFAHFAASPMVAAGVLFVTLLWPTFLMGVTLPLLARGLTRTIGATGHVVGSLYGWNTLGAAAGAFVSTWVFLPRFGLERSLWIAAAVNVSCAALATELARRRASLQRSSEGLLEEQVDEPTSLPHESLTFRTWTLVFGLTGFIALALEITWFRLLGVMLKSTAFTFGTLLGVYLSGLGLGAAIAARRVSRSRHPGAAFLLLQYGVTLYAAVSIVALVALIASGHPVKLVRYFGEYEPVDVFATVERVRDLFTFDPSALTALFEFTVLYLVVPAAIIGPPTLLLGMSFPFLQRATHTDLRRLGRRLGILAAANIAGSVLGAMMSGWLLLPSMGTAGTLKALVGMGVVIAVLIGRVRWPTRPRIAVVTSLAAALGSAVAVLALPDNGALWAALHSTSPRQILFGEDGSGVSVLKTAGWSAQGRVAVFVNGLGQSWIPYGSVHTALGALPALIHPNPQEVAIIGLGSGDTAYAAASRPETKQVICIEIMGAQLDTLRRLNRVQPYAGLTALLADPRVEHRIGDGRAYVRKAGRLFDIIEADALRPTSAHAGLLYSREYFAVLLAHLKPGGLAVSWTPTERIQATFSSVFPYVLVLGGDISLGSNAPIPFDPADLASRASALRRYYEVAEVDILGVLQPYLDSPPQSYAPADTRRITDLNTDMLPRDEFALPF